MVKRSQKTKAACVLDAEIAARLSEICYQRWLVRAYQETMVSCDDMCSYVCKELDHDINTPQQNWKIKDRIAHVVDCQC